MTIGAPDGVTIREQVAGDDAAVREVITLAFRDGSVADLDEALAQRPRGRALVASSDSGLVGHVRVTWGWIDAPSRLVDVLILSPLSVAPDWQGRGIGRALVGSALKLATELAAPLVFLEGSPDYYAKSGFELAAGLGFVRPSVRVPEGGFQVVRLPGYESWMKGALVYPDTFWEFDRVGLRTET
jgi:putative acetyltransferase